MDSGRDVLLHAIVSTLDKQGGDSGISITFESAGAMFSGITIPESTYLSKMGERFAEGYEKKGLDGSNWVATFDQMSGLISNTPRDEIKYVHLRDVTAYMGAGTNIKLQYWRVRIDSINGFDFATEGE